MFLIGKVEEGHAVAKDAVAAGDVAKLRSAVETHRNDITEGEGG